VAAAVGPPPRRAFVGAGEDDMPIAFGPRRAEWIRIPETPEPAPLSRAELDRFEAFDLAYRSLCALLYNYVPQSGHPGGSISSGRIVAGVLFDATDYDLGRPDREDADIVSYAAGHKAMGLYAMWALRDEVARIADPALLPGDDRKRLRLEDLLGFRRNPETATPLFRAHHAKPLDGHPTPATPFVRLSTGASGVGMASSIGLAFAARDYYGADAPRVHVIEGEGGLTPGRVSEALAAAGTASLDNVVVHVDWNQASIDTNRVCRDGEEPGEYVQWTPMELFYLHDWNVVEVGSGLDFPQVLAAQRRAASLRNGQPTVVVYRTTKGWKYGIEGRASHGAGHKLCSDAFYHALAELGTRAGFPLPTCESGGHRCEMGRDGATVMEECFYEALLLVRRALENDRPTAEALAARLAGARERLERRSRRPREAAPRVDAVYERVASPDGLPPELRLAPGTVTTLRGELGKALHHLNVASGGALLVAAADLLGSTSVNAVAASLGEGYWNAGDNPGARTLSIGGICEDAMAGILSGLSAYGRHLGVGSSYGAFLAPLGHVAARLHAIGSQAKAPRGPWSPMILVCAHAGLKTGEDGPTHADPQALQLLQENFPPGTAITLTPWDPAEIWPVLAAALRHRPAVLAPFVTRPNETVPDRAALGLAPVETAASGLYLLRRPRGRGEGTIVLQESAVTFAFVEQALPLLERDGLDPWVYSVSSAEMFDLLPAEEQRRLFPEERAREAMGITGFTLPTMLRFVGSELGRAHTLHPFRKGHFLGSGPGPMVLAEAGLDGESQYRAIRAYLEARARARTPSTV
jgi:transketolase